MQMISLILQVRVLTSSDTQYEASNTGLYQSGQESPGRANGSYNNFDNMEGYNNVTSTKAR